MNAAAIAQLADAVAERLAPRLAVELERLLEQRPRPRKVDAKTLAEILDVSVPYVYEHSAELGAERLGGEAGPGRPLRFDLTRAQAAFRERHADREPDRSPVAMRKSGRRRSGAGTVLSVPPERSAA